MEFSMEDVFSALIAFGVVGFVIFVIYAIMSKDEDVGEIATKKIGNQSLFLLEILLIAANAAEMLTAASIAATNTNFEVSYAGRLILHAVLALTSILGGFAFSKQLKEAFKYWKKPVQWIQVLFSLVLVIIGPLGNLLIMAYSMNQFDALLGYQDLVSTDSLGNVLVDAEGYAKTVRTKVGKWQNVIDGMLDPVLFGTYVVTLIHCFLVIVIATIAYDKVYGVEETEPEKEGKKDKEDKKDKKDKKKPETDDKGRPNPEKSVEIISNALDGEVSKIDLLLEYTRVVKSEYKHKDQIRGRMQNLAHKLEKTQNELKAKSKDKEGMENLSLQLNKLKGHAKKFYSDLKEIK